MITYIVNNYYKIVHVKTWGIVSGNHHLVTVPGHQYLFIWQIMVWLEGRVESHCRLKDTERLSVSSVLKCNHRQILKTHLYLWGSLLISHAQTLPHPTNNVECVYSGFFPSFNFVQGGERADSKIFSKTWTVFVVVVVVVKTPRNCRKSGLLHHYPKDFYLEL